MTELTPHLLQAIGALLAVLLMVLAWLGSRVHKQLDDIKTCLHDGMADIRKDFLGEIKDIREEIKDLRMDVSKLYTRTESLETKCTIRHDCRG